MIRVSVAFVLVAVAVACGGAAATPANPDAGATTLATGRTKAQACAFGEQCRSRACSAARDSGTCGSCQDVRPLGASCDGPLDVCSYTATCVDGRCRTQFVDVGGTCTIQPKGGSDCDSDLYCYPDGTGDQRWTPSGTCRPKIPLGQPCSTARDGTPASLTAMFACAEGGTCVAGSCRERRPSRLGEDCSDYGCEQGLACDQATRRCASSTLAMGSPCGIVGDQYIDGCPKGSVCGALGDVVRAPQSCLPLPHVGERCIGGTCEEGAFCENPYSGNSDPRSCTAKRVQGAACKYQEECGDELECRGGTCQAACK